MSTTYFPFHDLGFRSNPFRALDDEEWAAVAVLPDSVQPALAQGFVHLQLRGETGRGKTTTLLALAGHFRQAGRRVAYEYLPEGQERFTTTLAALASFALDEAQRLRPGERRRLLAAAQQGLQLIFSSHQDLAPLFEQRNLPLTTIYLDAAPPAHLQAILERRLAYFALESPPPITFTAEAVDYLWQQCSGNLRAIERFLYEFFQQLPGRGEIKLSAIKAFETL
ncbi:MAG: ATP-binding protein [Chloroflexi bacterium]|nr:ATP-binding protein [Chloroflexota bacterium]MCI0643695.1 ATP-binding protein [Chloroflexota bacterium]MCI0729079.1 ATP-binding protein [Chloroflexota bacterium]